MGSTSWACLRLGQQRQPDGSLVTEALERLRAVGVPQALLTPLSPRLPLSGVFLLGLNRLESLGGALGDSFTLMLRDRS